MLTEATIQKMNDLHLEAMAKAYEQQRSDSSLLTLSFDERLGLLIDRQYLAVQNRTLERRLAGARLKHPNACLENINWQSPRGLARNLIERLRQTDWIRYAHNVLITGPTGLGKTWLACALAQKACRDG
jgi:DNA replication protein DnaC